MKKKFYVFLCMLLGVTLFLIIQRALLAIYLIFAGSNSGLIFFDPLQLQVMTWTTTAIAVVIGLFYGNYLGHHWWPLVYGEDDVRALRGLDMEEPEEDTQRSVTIKPVRTPSAKVRLRSETRDQGWDFDDLINYDAPAVESLSGASAPTVISAVTLGEGTETKKRGVSKAKTTKTKTAAKPSVKPGTKSAAKSTIKKPAAKKPAAKKTAVRKTKPIS